MKPRWVARGGVKEPTDQKMQELVALLKAGESYEAIAKKFNITKQRVCSIRKHAGLPGRYKKRS